MMSLFFFFSSRRRHTRSLCDWSSDVCSSDLDSSAPSALREGTTSLPGLRVQRLGWPVTLPSFTRTGTPQMSVLYDGLVNRSEERRVGKECRSRGWQCH